MIDLQQKQEPERAVLCGLDLGTYDSNASMDELRELTKTAGAVVVATVVQARPAPDAATFIGPGKLDEIRHFYKDEADLLIIDDEISPSQQRNIEDFTGLRVIDRTTLILDIFAQRARTKEGKLQVELAQLNYRLPRIGGQGHALSRLGGGIGTRGPGESKLESDRRHIMRRINSIRRELKSVEKRRNYARERRDKTGVETAVLVGYTNAGKSTLMNALTDAGVLVEDKLFATLDPTSRALRLPSGRTVMLIDTVGLIRRLPHELVDAFHSTLEEAADADVIINVVDASSPDCAQHMEVTSQLLQELGAGSVPVVTALNKCDKITPDQDFPVLGHGVAISALDGTGLGNLEEAIEDALPKDRVRCVYLFPYTDLSPAAEVREDGEVFSEEYTDNGLKMDVLSSTRMAGKYTEFLTDRKVPS